MRTLYLNASEENSCISTAVGLDRSQAVSEFFEPGEIHHCYLLLIMLQILFGKWNRGGADQIGEVVEHLLHTATNVIFYLSFPEESGL